MSFNTTAITTVIVTVGSAQVKKIVNKEPPGMKPIIGGFVLGLFLFAFGGINEKLATQFCILLIVASLLINGMSLFQGVQTVVTNGGSFKGGSKGQGFSGGGGGGGSGGGR